MKTMKNVLMILLGAALVLSLAGVGAVAAEDETSDWETTNEGSKSITVKPITEDTTKQNTMTVSYTIGESFSVTIPTDVTLDETGSKDATFTVDSATLGSNSMFVVTVTSANVWNMTLDADNKIPYTMKYKVIEDGNEVTKEITVNEEDTNYVTIYETSTSVSQISKTLTFVKNEGTLPTKAGTYTDTLTFTITHTPTTGTTTPAGEAESSE